jgi:hypothetical protein
VWLYLPAELQYTAAQSYSKSHPLSLYMDRFQTPERFPMPLDASICSIMNQIEALFASFCVRQLRPQNLHRSQPSLTQGAQAERIVTLGQTAAILVHD